MVTSLPLPLYVSSSSSSSSVHLPFSLNRVPTQRGGKSMQTWQSIFLSLFVPCTILKKKKMEEKHITFPNHEDCFFFITVCTVLQPLLDWMDELLM